MCDVAAECGVAARAATPAANQRQTARAACDTDATARDETADHADRRRTERCEPTHRDEHRERHAEHAAHEKSRARAMRAPAERVARGLAGVVLGVVERLHRTRRT